MLGAEILIAGGLILAIPVPMAVTILKGHHDLFDLGLVYVGTVWWIASLRLARPNSRWARWFYSDRKLARARERYGSQGQDRPRKLG